MNTKRTVTTGLGRDVARAFFTGWGLPYLRTHQPHLVDRIAAILCLGSDSLGNDDDLSKDHNWGPRFALVLTGEDKRRHGRRLQRDLREAAPREWGDHTFRHNPDSVTVESLNQYFIRLVGKPSPPVTSQGWRQTREENLYMIRHATIFHDPLGQFTARRQAFWNYPEAYWLERVWEEVWKVWHFGEYNFIDRVSHRGDPVAVAICIGEFSQAAMRLAMLLSRDFTPYWKWLPAEFRKVGGAEELDQRLTELAGEREVGRQVSLVGAICSDIHLRLVEELDVEADPKGHPHQLHLAGLELRRRADEFRS